jgi:hypothetical protein
MTPLPSLWGNGNSIWRSRGSALGILWAGRAWVHIQNVDNDYETHLALYSVSGRLPGALWLEVQQPGSEVITRTLILRSLCMSLQRGQTTFTFTFYRKDKSFWNSSPCSCSYILLSTCLRRLGISPAIGRCITITIEKCGSLRGGEERLRNIVR